jgi:hypothetical protein
MTRWVQLLLTTINIGCGTVSSFEWKSPVPAVVAGAIQACITQIAHMYNTDGTPQAVAYVPTEQPSAKRKQ